MNDMYAASYFGSPLFEWVDAGKSGIQEPEARRKAKNIRTGDSRDGYEKK